MIDLENVITAIRSKLEEITSFPIYTGLLSDTDNPKEGLVKINEGNPWRFNIKEQNINLEFVLRFKIDDIEPTGGGIYTEDTAARECYNIVNRIMFKTIPPGVILQDATSSFGYDDDNRYVCITQLVAYVTRI